MLSVEIDYVNFEAYKNYQQILSTQCVSNVRQNGTNRNETLALFASVTTETMHLLMRIAADILI
jgi:hypothetical protein